MCISCRPHVDVYKGEGIRLMWTHVVRGRGVKTLIFWGRHKWIAPKVNSIESRQGLSLSCSFCEAAILSSMVSMGTLSGSVLVSALNVSNSFRLDHVCYQPLVTACHPFYANTSALGFCQSSQTGPQIEMKRKGIRHCNIDAAAEVIVV